MEEGKSRRSELPRCKGDSQGAFIEQQRASVPSLPGGIALSPGGKGEPDRETAALWSHSLLGSNLHWDSCCQGT